MPMNADESHRWGLAVDESTRAEPDAMILVPGRVVLAKDQEATRPGCTDGFLACSIVASFFVGGLFVLGVVALYLA